MCEKLRELIPRQQFDIAIQAALGAKVIASENVKSFEKRRSPQNVMVVIFPENVNS